MTFEKILSVVVFTKERRWSMEKCKRCDSCKDGKCEVVLLCGCSEIKGEFVLSAYDLYELTGYCPSFSCFEREKAMAN